MKKIGMIFAMKEELEETLKKLEIIKEHKLYDLTIYECQFQNCQCFLVESGVGKVNAARTTQLLISNMKIDYLFNIGVAASIAREVKKCDIVIATDLVQHDFDLTAFDREKGVVPNIGKSVKCSNYLLEIAKKTLLNEKIFFGTIASGDIFVSEEKMARKIHEKFGALCVEMEGAAIAQVSYLCHVPFLVIRSISDSPYEKYNQITFDEFLRMSSNVIANFTIQLLKNIE